MGKKSSSPPDVTGAAATEGKYARKTARDQTYADRPDQHNAFGSSKWTTEKVRDPATGKKVTKWTQKEKLNKKSKEIFNARRKEISGKANFSKGLNSRIAAEMGSPVNWEQFGDVIDFDFDGEAMRQNAEDAMYQKSKNRLDPQYEAAYQNKMLELRNRGLKEGDQAYDSAMASYGRDKNDAYEQARLGAVNEGRTEFETMWNTGVEGNEIANGLRDKKIEEYIGKRGFSLAEQQSLNVGDDLNQLVSTYSGGGGQA